MIRHYESIGLLGSVGRTAAGYRVYGESALHTLRFIRRARQLEFSLDRIKELLALWQDQARTSRDVRQIALGQLEDLEARAEALDAMVRTLRRLVADCDGDDRPDCPILDDFAAPSGDDAS